MICKNLTFNLILKKYCVNIEVTMTSYFKWWMRVWGGVGWGGVGWGGVEIYYYSTSSYRIGDIKT